MRCFHAMLMLMLYAGAGYAAFVNVAAAAPYAESTRELRKLQHALASHNTFYMHARASMDAMGPGEDGLHEHIVRGML